MSAGLAMQFIEKRTSLRIRGNALFLKNGPRRDLRGSGPVRGMALDPLEDFGIAFASFQLAADGVEFQAGELEKLLIHRASERIFASRACDGGAALVKESRQQDITSQTDTWTAGRLPG